MVVAADEPGRLGDVGGRGARRRSASGRISRRNISVPARLRLCPSSPICSIWATIALMSTGPCGAHRRLQQRAEHVGHPAQPLDHLGPVGAVAQHLAEALVQRAPGGAAVHRVAQLEHPHRRARSRRPSGPTARWWWHGSSGDPVAAGERRARPPPPWRPAPRTAVAPISAPRSGPGRAVPADRRPGVQELAAGQAERLRGRPDVDQLGAGREHPLDRRARWPGPRRGSASTRARSASVPASPSGGRQSTSVTWHGLRGQRVGEQARRRR